MIAKNKRLQSIFIRLCGPGKVARKVCVMSSRTKIICFGKMVEVNCFRYSHPSSKPFTYRPPHILLPAPPILKSKRTYFLISPAQRRGMQGGQHRTKQKHTCIHFDIIVCPALQTICAFQFLPARHLPSKRKKGSCIHL